MKHGVSGTTMPADSRAPRGQGARPGCGGHCACCTLGGLIGDEEGGPRGRQLVGWALLAFILPWFVALGAGALFPGNSRAQTLAVPGALLLALLGIPLLSRKLYTSQGGS